MTFELESSMPPNNENNDHRAYYSSRHDILDTKKKINYAKSVCPELKEIIHQIKCANNISQSKLNLSQYSDLNFSQIGSFICDDGCSYQEILESIIENNDLGLIDETHPSSLKQYSCYEKSFTDGIIENFQISENPKINRSLCDFDDQQIGNGNTNFFEFYQENE